MADVLQRLATEWIGYKAEVHTYLEHGDRFGAYSGTYTAMTAPSRICTSSATGNFLRMTQYVDRAMVFDALS